MTCKDFDALLDTIREGSLTQDQRAAIDAHLAQCAACRFKARVMDDCRTLDENGEVPEHFSSAWRQRIMMEEEPQVKQFPRFTRFLAMAAALVVLVGGTWMAGNQRREAARGGRDNAQVMADYGAASQPSLSMGAPYAESAAKTRDVQDAAKIIRTARLELSTREFDSDYAALLAAISELGGRVQTTSLYNSQGSLRVVYLTLRIPEDKLDQAIARFKGVGRLVSFSESAEDVTEQYADNDNRLKTQQAKMERLQALLAKAESVEDLVTIEGSISETQYEIDRLTGLLQGLDSRIKDATLDLTLNELSPLETSRDQDETLAQRILGGMRAAWEAAVVILGDLVVFLAVALPYLIVLAIVILIIVFLIKRRKKQ